MKKTKIFTLIIVTTLLLGALILSGGRFGDKNGMFSPMIRKTTVQSTQGESTPTPGPRPKTIKYDSSTDLKAELEKINPQVFESDFE